MKKQESIRSVVALLTRSRGIESCTVFKRLRDGALFYGNKVNPLLLYRAGMLDLGFIPDPNLKQGKTMAGPSLTVLVPVILPELTPEPFIVSPDILESAYIQEPLKQPPSLSLF